MYWIYSYYDSEDYNYTLLSFKKTLSTAKTIYINRKYLPEFMIHLNCKLYNISTVNEVQLNIVEEQIKKEKIYDMSVS